MVEDLPEYIQDNLRELQGYFSSIEDLCDHQDDIIYYPGCEDMADVARQMVEEGYISVPDHLIYYFDYERMGATYLWRVRLLKRGMVCLRSQFNRFLFRPPL